MRHQDFRTLQINGQELQGSELVDYTLNSSSDQLKYLGQFMQEWLNENEYISVQSSGSTGSPKKIKVLKTQMLASAQATAGFFNFKEGQTALLALPMHYIAGKMMVVRALYSGLNLILLEPSTHPFEQLNPKQKIDFAPFTPMQLDGVKDTLSIRTILLGGGPVSKSQEAALQNVSAEIYHGYGMTETLSHIALRKVNGPDADQIYRALPQVFFEQDKRDCLVATVPFLKEKVITNDVIQLIDRQSFIWQSRFDHVINSGGIKLFPEKIESQISHFIETAFFVFGMADEVLGQRLCLFIEGEHPSPAHLKILQSQIQQVLKGAEKPKHIYFILSFSRTASGKIQRAQTVDLFFKSNFKAD